MVVPVFPNQPFNVVSLSLSPWTSSTRSTPPPASTPTMLDPEFPANPDSRLIDEHRFKFIVNVSLPHNYLFIDDESSGCQSTLEQIQQRSRDVFKPISSRIFCLGHPKKKKKDDQKKKKRRPKKKKRTSNKAWRAHFRFTNRTGQKWENGSALPKLSICILSVIEAVYSIGMLPIIGRCQSSRLKIGTHRPTHSMDRKHTSNIGIGLHGCRLKGSMSISSLLPSLFFLAFSSQS
ncbi:hypothetical protein FB446DRAFT_481988 [Lentinula raphanica]|nr:hypothetical protein FB446DRAFT_481988 [Lentinula raphanica]